MHARVSTFEGPPGGIEEAVGTLRDDMLPRVREIPGFSGMLVLADRQSGKQVGVTFWESEEAMRTSEEAANKLRTESLSTGERLVSVERFEVVLDERH